jgi:hypothetical protein
MRAVTACSGGAIAVCWVLASLFLLDVVFAMDVPQRLVVMVLGGAAVMWAWLRYSWPVLRQRESLMQVALLVECQHGICSDLVAALEFESPEAEQWGSRQLQQAVIAQVADRSDAMDVGQGLTHREARRRVSILLATGVVFLAVATIYPEYVRIFARRLVLAADSYPSATRIETVMINGQRVLRRNVDGVQPHSVSVAQGMPVVFQVHVTGQLPESGQVRLHASSTSRRTLALERWRPQASEQDKDEDEDTERAGSSGEVAVYQARLNRLIDPVSYRLHLGDAWTAPAEIRLIPLPVVEIDVTVQPPEYAALEQVPDAPAGSRQWSVLEGSAVHVAIESLNRKRIVAAWCTIGDAQDSRRFDMQPDGSTQLRWMLPIQGTGLEQVRKETPFEIQVTDQDGLHLESPLRGLVRIKIDQPPVCSADIVHRVVLPTAKPEIRYRVHDDYGIAELDLHIQIERARTASDQEITDDQRVSLPVLPVDQLPRADRLPYTGRYVLDLARLPVPGAPDATPLVLNQGDRLKLTLVATDERGPMLGKTSPSEPLVLEISDEAGVLSVISEADQHSEERLNEIIKKQLGIVESP